MKIMIKSLLKLTDATSAEVLVTGLITERGGLEEGGR